MNEKWSESDARHQDTLVTLNTNNNNTVLQISSNHIHKETVASLTASHKETVALLSASNERQNTVSNKTMLQMQFNYKEMLSMVLDKDKADLPTVAAGSLTPKQKCNHAATPTNRTK